MQIEKSPETTDFAALTRVLVAKAKSSDDATRYTALRWLNCFLTQCIDSSRDAMMSFMAGLVVAVLPCLSHSNRDIKEAAVSCNSTLLSLNLSKHLASVGIGPVLTALSYELTSQQQPTRLEALRWFQVLTSLPALRCGQQHACFCTHLCRVCSASRNHCQHIALQL
jgi:hypothetical protein